MKRVHAAGLANRGGGAPCTCPATSPDRWAWWCSATATAAVIARLGTGLNPDDIRPLAGPSLAGELPLMIGWIATDSIIPASQRAAVAAGRDHDPGSGRHLDLITWLPWRRAVIAFLGRFAPGPNSDVSI